MWSINLFVNKLLKAVEENLDESAENPFNFVGSYAIQQSPNNQSRTSVASHFVDVRFHLLYVPFEFNTQSMLINKSLAATRPHIDESVKLLI